MYQPGRSRSAVTNVQRQPFKHEISFYPRLQLSYERIKATGMYLLDCGDSMILYLSRGLHQMILERVLGAARYEKAAFQGTKGPYVFRSRIQDVDESIVELPELESDESELLRNFVNWLNSAKPFVAPIRIVR